MGEAPAAEIRAGFGIHSWRQAGDVELSSWDGLRDGGELS